MNTNTYQVNYAELKKIIVRNIKRDKDYATKFSIKASKLEADLESKGVDLIVVNTGLESKPIKDTDIPFISFFMKDERLKWVDSNDGKEVATIILVNGKSSNQNLDMLLHKLRQDNEASGIDVDRGKIVSEIIATYPCYFAQVISYKSNNPDVNALSSFTVTIKANLATINDENYRFNQKDISE